MKCWFFTSKKKKQKLEWYGPIEHHLACGWLKNHQFMYFWQRDSFSISQHTKKCQELSIVFNWFRFKRMNPQLDSINMQDIYFWIHWHMIPSIDWLFWIFVFCFFSFIETFFQHLMHNFLFFSQTDRYKSG